MTPPRRHRSTRPRPGFTLVELLVVIVIIGILMGLLVPAVTGALQTARETARKTELSVMEQALEDYRQSRGDYPPDFSDWRKVERHLQRAFPDIDDNELKILAQFTHLDDDFERVPVPTGGAASLDPRPGTAYAHYRACIDPGEALVFFLGGFSSDSKRPITGPGGPLSLLPAFGSLSPAQQAYNHFQYNAERSEGEYSFDLDRLSIYVHGDSDIDLNPLATAAGVAYTYSSDELREQTIGGVVTPPVRGQYTERGPTTAPRIRFLPDPFPVFDTGDQGVPVVYFAGDSYQNTFIPASVSGGWLTTTNGWHALNAYFTTEPEFGVARPYLSDRRNTNAGGFLWAEENRYQLIHPGSDESFGGVIAAGVASATAPAAAGPVTQYPTGDYIDAGGNVVTESRGKYIYESGGQPFYGTEVPELDNVANFSERTFASGMPL